MNTQHISRRFRRFLRANRAVSALEYAILVGVITVAVGGAVLTFSNTITAAIGNMGNQIAVTGNSTTNTDLSPSP